MIPMTAEYALRAVVVLARDAGNTRSADEIAAATSVPRRYVNKVLQALVRARLVRSQSGPGGGYALLRPPETVSILDVVSAVEPIPRLRSCPLGIPDHTSLCPLHQQLDEVCASTERAFARVTIGQLLSQSGSAPPLCKTSKHKKKRPRLEPG
jgi:Rrf2 family transcriptional regulator, nitric oxide-sensitive transcriptional repressor